MFKRLYLNIIIIYLHERIQHTMYNIYVYFTFI